MKHIKLYTDGACSGNPGPGGWAAVAFDGDDCIMKHGDGFRHTTNNRMEILAIAEGLSFLREQLKSSRETDIKVTVCSDSQLLVNTMNKGWARKSNRDLWYEVDKAISLFPYELEFEWVKGHSTDKKNALADSVAVAWSQKAGKVDSVYEAISAPKDEQASLFDSVEELKKKNPAVHTMLEPEITQIRLMNPPTKELREVEVDLSNGTTVRIRGLRPYGGFEQYNCTQAEAQITVDIAIHFAGWLNGKEL